MNVVYNDAAQQYVIQFDNATLTPREQALICQQFMQNLGLWAALTTGPLGSANLDTINAVLGPIITGPIP